MIKIIYSVAIIIGFASTAFAIRCHSCSSANEVHCDDPFKADKRFETECGTKKNGLVPGLNSTASGCLKEEHTLKKGVDIIIRTCYFGDITEACKGSEKQISCDFCTENLCNSSTTTGAFAAIIMLFAVLVRMTS